MSNFSPFFMDRPRPPRRLMEQYFGMGLAPQDYLTLLGVPAQGAGNDNIHGPWRNAIHQDVGSTIKQDQDKFQVNIDVQHFKLGDINVKIVDGCLVVEANHDERSDSHGFVTRNFTRRYPLPNGVNPDLVTSKLSSDAVLTIVAPLNAPPRSSDERIVPIVTTGPVKKQRGGGPVQ